MATASTFVNVFSGVLVDSLDKLREEDDVGLLDRLPDLLVCHFSLSFGDLIAIRTGSIVANNDHLGDHFCFVDNL